MYWLSEGDANTKCFHNYSSVRRNSKSIWGLLNQHGETIEDESQLKLVGVTLFSDHFTDDGVTNIEDQLKVIRLFPLFLMKKNNPLWMNLRFLILKVFLRVLKKIKVPSQMDGRLDFTSIYLIRLVRTF